MAAGGPRIAAVIRVPLIDHVAAEAAERSYGEERRKGREKLREQALERVQHVHEGTIADPRMCDQGSAFFFAHVEFAGKSVVNRSLNIDGEPHPYVRRNAYWNEPPDRIPCFESLEWRSVGVTSGVDRFDFTIA